VLIQQIVLISAVLNPKRAALCLRCDTTVS
jgi:hypothetical protein